MEFAFQQCIHFVVGRIGVVVSLYPGNSRIWPCSSWTEQKAFYGSLPSSPNTSGTTTPTLLLPGSQQTNSSMAEGGKKDRSHSALNTIDRTALLKQLKGRKMSASSAKSWSRKSNGLRCTLQTFYNGNGSFCGCVEH